MKAALLALLASLALAAQDSRSASGPASRPSLGEILERARDLYGREDFPGAEAALKEAFLLSPGSPEVHRMLGALHLRVRRYADALRSFERFLDLEPGEIGRCAWIGHACHELGRLEEAESWYRKVLRAAPGNLEAKRGLALTLHKRGEEREAEALFREVAAGSKAGAPGLGDARRWLGEILLARGDAAGAILELESAKAEDPFSPEVAYALARAYARAGDPTRAEAEGERRKSLAKHQSEIEVLRARLRASPGDLDAHVKIATHQDALGDFAGAERTLRRAVARFPLEPPARLSLVDFLEARARLEEARVALEEAALLFPEAPAVFERAVRFHRARGDFAAMVEAAQAYHRLTGRAPR